MNRSSRNVGVATRIARAVLPAAIAATTLLAACSTDKLTEVDTPDQITPEQANSPAGAAALRTAALGNFANYFAGDNAGGGVGMNIATGLLGDEMLTARGGTEHLDSRAVNEAVFPATAWSTFGQANTQIIRALKAVKQYAPDGATKVSQIAQLYMLEGFTYVIAAEAYCNGIPVGNADDLAPKTEILSNSQLFDKAIAYFDTALTTAATTDTKIRNGEIGRLMQCPGGHLVVFDRGMFVGLSSGEYVNACASSTYDFPQGDDCTWRTEQRIAGSTSGPLAYSYSESPVAGRDCTLSCRAHATLDVLPR